MGGLHQQPDKATSVLLKLMSKTAGAVPEVQAGKTVHQLLQLGWREESLQAVRLDDLLQLCHQPLLRCSIATTTTTYSAAATNTGDVNKYLCHCPCSMSLLDRHVKITRRVQIHIHSQHEMTELACVLKTLLYAVRSAMLRIITHCFCVSIMHSPMPAHVSTGDFVPSAQEVHVESGDS